MSRITYTAKRELISGHTVDTDYSIDVRMRQIDRETESRRRSAYALDGSAEHIYHGATIRWTVFTAWNTDTELLTLREFYRSVEAGESFTFDPYGTVAVPDDPVTVQMDVDTIREQRSGPAAELYAITFTMREV